MHELFCLCKTLQAQKAQSDKIKAKLRRLEEDNAKKDRQIEQLLDPAKVTYLSSANEFME